MCQLVDGTVLVLLVVASIIDWKRREIPIWILVCLSVVVTTFAIFNKDIHIWYRFAGAVLGILFFGISKVSGESVGYGDSWLILLLGIHLGILRTLQVLFVASLMAGVFALFYLWRHKWNRDSTLPFVPFITIAYLGVMFG